ncbi:MAG: 6-phosphofructokinase [Planctomycetota bacterium]|nr:6-phosphofructokinase [Planctomycetota bacterium]
MPTRQAKIKRVAMLFAGGPAPAANAVISAAAVSFLRGGSEVIGIKHGYSNLIEYEAGKRLLLEGKDYIRIEHATLKRTRNSQGILIGTSRANPGKEVFEPAHLADRERSAPLGRVYEGLCSLGVDALISIGGDDTLKTANKLKMYQDLLPPEAKRIPIVHLPKTIDNDYTGIDFTFGYFTAVNMLAEELLNLLYDADAAQSYFLAECMGRSAGWLAYGAAIAGEASLVISVEDISGEYRTEETVTNSKTGVQEIRPIMNMEPMIHRILGTILARESEGKNYGVIVLAEGLAELLPMKYLVGIPRDEHGHIAIADVRMYELFAKLLMDAYKEKTGRKRRVKGLQLGYEARCARPTAFDAMLGSQLGVGAYRALVEQGLNGVMVSVQGQLDLVYEPFEKLVDSKTLVTVVRYIKQGSDFHRLARFLETGLNY